MKLFSFLIVMNLLIGAIGASAQTPTGDAKPASIETKPATTETQRQLDAEFLKTATLRQLEAELMQAAAERGSQGYMSYYAEDSVELPNGGDVLLGKIAIAKTMGFLDDKNNSLMWKPLGSDVSGDLAFTYGTYEFHSKDKNGRPIVDYGKYTTIWKRQTDRSWKVVLDMGNATPAAK
jgi:ketosteroid isomerase-like protein